MDDDMIKAMKTALDFEKKGFRIYTEVGEKTKNPIVARTFKHLAEQEKNHIQEINEYIERQKIDMMGDRAEETSQFFSITVSEFKRESELSESDIKAHEAALELERKSYDFYKKELAIAKSTELQGFFEFLMTQEALHWELVTKTLEFIRDPAGFYRKDEQWIFEGDLH